MKTGVGISNVGILFICKNIVWNEPHDTLAVFVLDDFENRLERSNNHVPHWETNGVFFCSESDDTEHGRS